MRASVVFVFGILLGTGCAVAHGQTEPTTATEPPPPPVMKLSGPARISGGVMAGNILTKTQPVYPLEARAAGVGGTVVMHAIIGKDGLIAKLTVVSGPELLQNAAMDAVKSWTYKPYLLNGVPTEVDTTIIVNFNLNRPAPKASPSDN